MTTITAYEFRRLPDAPAWAMPARQPVQVDAVAIRAYRFDGAGTAVTSYEAQDTDGRWWPFRKKDNKGIRFPAPSTMQWGRPEYVGHGMSRAYRYTTEPFKV